MFIFLLPSPLFMCTQLPSSYRKEIQWLPEVIFTSFQVGNDIIVNLRPIKCSSWNMRNWTFTPLSSSFPPLTDFYLFLQIFPFLFTLISSHCPFFSVLFLFLHFHLCSLYFLHFLLSEGDLQITTPFFGLFLCLSAHNKILSNLVDSIMRHTLQWWTLESSKSIRQLKYWTNNSSASLFVLNVWFY